MKVGVLALQGAFREHIRMLRELGAEAVEIRLPAELDEVDGLIIPGGESTTMRKLMADYGLVDPLREFAASGKPVFGTCAGLIVMAERLGGRTRQETGSELRRILCLGHHARALDLPRAKRVHGIGLRLLLARDTVHPDAEEVLACRERALAVRPFEHLRMVVHRRPPIEVHRL